MDGAGGGGHARGLEERGRGGAAAVSRGELRALAVALSLTMCAVDLWGTAAGLRAERFAFVRNGTVSAQTDTR